MAPSSENAGLHRVRTGIGGWTFEPWRGGTFYPPGLPHSQELQWASRRLPAIEINGTFYRGQSPATYARWRNETPPGFMFSLKAQKACTHRPVLAEAGESVRRFLGGGLVELGEKLGPVLWQFPPSKAFDVDDFGAFLALLPARQDGLRLRHALEVRHTSFRDPAFLELARRHGCAVVFTDSDEYPVMSEMTADFVYARLVRASAEQAAGYTEAALDAWADRALAWGREDRDVFLFFINGAKEKAPAAAGALLGRLGLAPLA